MRSELLGPLPLAIGVLIVAAAVLLPARAPAPPCDCPVYTAADFDALERGRYAGVANGSTLILDGRVVEISPSEFLAFPYRLVRLEGSVVRFNVTGYDPTTGRVGDWVRLVALHAGESEAQGPDTGHRWSHAGKTSPPGASVVSLAGLALGISIAAWGAATWAEFGRSRARARALGARLEAARRFAASDPALRASKDWRASLDEAGALLRRGQSESAAKALDEIDGGLSHARKIAGRIEAARGQSLRLAAEGKFTGPAAASLDEAERRRSGGDLGGAEKALVAAEATLEAYPRVHDLIAAAERSLEANRRQGVEDAAAAADLESARAAAGDGRFLEGLQAAERAVARLREVSPGARRAAAEIQALKEFLADRPEFDRAAEVRDRVRDGEELYRLGQYERALAEARVGIWLADPDALAHSDLEALVRASFKARGFTVDPPGSPPPPFGFLAAKDGARTLVVTTAWREFPSERTLFAARDFLDEQGAERALVYSSAFTDTSTDERLRIVEVGELVELLREAALGLVAKGGPDG